MKMELVKKDSEGHEVDKRGNRRIIIEGQVRNQKVDEVTKEWVDKE